VSSRLGRGLVTCVCVAGATTLIGAAASAAPLEPTALPAVPGGEAEPNDSPAQATPIQSGARIRANLLAAGDVDCYSFEARAGERVFADVVTSGSAGVSNDSALALIGSDGATVLESDDNDGSQGPLSSGIAGATIPSDGVYYLRVRDNSGAASAERPYDLYLQLRAGAPAAEVGSTDTPEGAQPLGDGEVAGSLSSAIPAEADWYSINLQAGDTVFLSLDLDPGRDGQSFKGRLGFGLFGDDDPQNKRVAVLTVPAPGEASDSTFPSEALTMTVERSGTYYARVDTPEPALPGPDTTYDLSATVIPAAQPSCRTYASPFPSGLIDGGAVDFPISVDDAAQIGRVAVRLDLEQDVMADLDVSLLRDSPAAEVPLFAGIGATKPKEQEYLEVIFDEYAAVPPLYRALRPLDLRPRGALTALQGQQAQGSWGVVVADDNANSSVGEVRAAELVVCPEAARPGTISAALAAPAPKLFGLTIAPRRFRALKSGPTIVTKRRREAGGAVVSYEDSAAAAMSALVLRPIPGRRVGGRCVRATAANLTKRECTRYRRLGRISHADVPGRNRFRFSGRLAGKPLPPGSYWLEAAAWATSGLKSAPVRAAFTILPPRVRE
jgi:subtilisin-like proprotein convertase family protein